MWMLHSKYFIIIVARFRKIIVINEKKMSVTRFRFLSQCQSSASRLARLDSVELLLGVHIQLVGARILAIDRRRCDELASI